MRRFRQLFGSSAFSALCLVASGAALAATPELNIAQLNHRVFTAAEGAPSDIYALAQTTDGTLWIGGATGLTRFDGVRFVSYPGPGEDRLPSSNVSSLLPTRDGGLWIGLRPGGVAHLLDGHVTAYGEGDGASMGTVAQFSVDNDGSVWAAGRLGLAHLQGQRWEVVPDPRLRVPYGVLIDSIGNLWVATLDGLFARAPNESQFRLIDHREYLSPRGTPLVLAAGGGIWAAASQGIIHVKGPLDAPRLVQTPGISNSGGPILLDDVGDLWFWDKDPQNLARAQAGELKLDNPPEAGIHPERFVLADGAGLLRGLAFLQDREHNIWVATNNSLHRFSHSNVLRDAVPACEQDPLSSTGPFAAGNDGALWMACNDGRGPYVAEVRDGRAVRRPSLASFTVSLRDADGTIWFGGPSSIAHLEGERLVTSPLPLSLQGRPMQMLVPSGRATWVSISRRSTYRFLDGMWSENGGLAELPHTWALVGTADAAGTLWLGYPNNRVARVIGQSVQRFGVSEGLDLGNALSIQLDGTRVWVGGDWAVAWFNGRRFVRMRTASELPIRGVSGILRARNGDMWLNGTSGIAHISRLEIEEVLRNPSHLVSGELFDYLDGVPGTANHLRPQGSIVEASDGRLWFSMTGGIVSIDPMHLSRNTLPPPVNIWTLSTALAHYSHPRAGLRLPVHTTDLRIEYTAGSLTVPERVRFRYKLEGAEPNWQDVGSRREANYTNLGPGEYTFHVIAANNDGVWNNAGASVAFTILPAFYETRWFYALCALGCLLVLAAMYRLRVRQVAARVRNRLEDRVAERERIARELHDTLLQGIQGLIWRFQAASDRIPRGEPARQLMEQSLDRADQLLAESRDRVKEMRPSAAVATELAQALAAEGEQFAQLHAAAFRVSVQGTRSALHPIVREECFLIAREALTNAFRHAQAETVEVEVTYGDHALQVRVRDDGQGISTAVLEGHGKPGHFGLIGMRERAKKLGGSLEVWSKPASGTEIDLRVPANVAYARTSREASGLWGGLGIFRSSAPRARRFRDGVRS